MIVMAIENASSRNESVQGPIADLSIPVFQAVCTVLAVIGNAIVLSVFLYKRNLITAFSIYYMVLFIANICFTLTQNVIEVMWALSGNWPFGSYVCSFYLYGTGIFWCKLIE